jgi:LAO/AO transport system kinase
MPPDLRTPQELADGIRAGNRRALARSLSLVESERAGADELLTLINPYAGKATRLGITGPAGVGKSTLTAGLITEIRKRGKTVAIVAVDPSSPYSGGALLGDRIRMDAVSMDDGVFIRSMASRGVSGGIAAATSAVCDCLDAFGFDLVVIETMGTGQAEVAIASLADVTVVVLSPEAGDGLQGMKAGLLEAADLFVVNKSDRPDADRFARDLSDALTLAPERRGKWRPPVGKAVATSGEGIGWILDEADAFLAQAKDQGWFAARRRAAAESRLLDAIRTGFLRAFKERVGASDEWRAAVDALASRAKSLPGLRDKFLG